MKRSVPLALSLTLCTLPAIASPAADRSHPEHYDHESSTLLIQSVGFSGRERIRGSGRRGRIDYTHTL